MIWLWGGVNALSEQETVNGGRIITLHAVQAIKAGVNLLLYRNSLDETIQIIDDLAQLAQTDNELYNNIEISFDKITNFKTKFSI